MKKPDSWINDFHQTYRSLSFLDILLGLFDQFHKGKYLGFLGAAKSFRKLFRSKYALEEFIYLKKRIPAIQGLYAGETVIFFSAI